MAFCSQCGESIRDDAAFCTACGKPVGPPSAPDSDDTAAAETPPADQPPPPPPAPAAPAPPPPPEPPPASSKRPLLIGIAIAAVVGVLAVGAWFVWQQSTSDDSATAVPATTAVAPDSTVSTSTTDAPTTSTTSTTIATTTTTLPPTTTTLPADLVSGVEATGVFVEEGSGATADSLQTSVDMARAQGWALSTVATAAEPEGGASAYAGSIATALNAGTVVVVTPTTLGWATQETQFYPEEFDRAWSFIPETSTEDEAVRSFVTSVLGGPDSVGVMDSASAFWLLLRADGTTAEFTLGDPGDTPLLGDWDCDGIQTPGAYRPSTGQVFLRNTVEEGPIEVDYEFSRLDTVPFAGDFDGDGCDTVSYYVPAEGLVVIFNTPEAAVEAADDTTSTDLTYEFGIEGDLPFAGDFDGDGIDTIGLFRPSNGVFYLKNTHTEGPADVEFAFGASGDLPISGDWTDQDGADSVAVYRPTTGTFFFRYDNSAGPADETLELGVVDVLPVAGAFGLNRSG